MDIPGRFHSLLKKQIDNLFQFPYETFALPIRTDSHLMNKVTPTLKLRNTSRPGARCAFTMLTALIVLRAVGRKGGES